MPIQTKFTVKGLKGLQKKFKDAPDKFENAIINAMERTAERMIIAAKNEAPPASFQNRTGNLRASIGATKPDEIPELRKRAYPTVIINGVKYIARAMVGARGKKNRFGRVEKIGKKFVATIRATMKYAPYVEAKKNFLIRNIMRYRHELPKNINDDLQTLFHREFGS